MNYLDRTFQPRIDLAREADFAIGVLRVRPSCCEIEAEGVRQVLQRRVMQVLVALAHPSAEVVSQDELISRCWGGLAVGEDAVGRCIGQLRRLAAQWPDPPFEITTIAGVGYRMAPAARPAPEAAGPVESVSGRRMGRLPVLAIAGAGTVFLALAAFALWPGHGLAPALGPAPSKLAVLPFEPLTASPAEHSFAADLADALKSALSTSQMPVVSREDAQTLRGADQAQRLEVLGVRLLFDGTVTTEGDTLRARVRLDDPGKHVTLWSVDLSGPASNPDALEAQVGARAIAVLNCAGQALRPARGLSDPEVLALYLHACDLVADRGWGDDAQAVYGVLDTLRQVAVRAPGFAPGHSTLARLLAYYRPVLPAGPEAAAEAEREARRALAIDSKDGDAYVALSSLRPKSDYAGRERLADQALAVDPSGASPNLTKAGLLFDVGLRREGATYLQRGAAANPASLAASTDILLAENGLSAAANAELDRRRRLWPHSPQIWAERLTIYDGEGRWDEALALLNDRQSRPKLTSDAEIQVWRTYFTASKSRTPAAVAEARRQMFTAPVGRHNELRLRIGMLARLGLTDDAFLLADRYAREGMNGWDSPVFVSEPGTAALRRDPRFMPLAARFGLVDYWRATNRWPDFCAEPGLPYDCKAEAARVASGHPS